MGNIPALDGLRGLAILMVMVYHFHWQIGNSHDIRLTWLFGGGWSGVDLFFVLSGFLITGILVDAQDGPRYFRNFYIRRALRIFPVYYATLALIFLVLPRVLHPVPQDLADTVPLQPWYWLYGVNIMEATRTVTSFFHTGHLWSLSVEEQFYLVWPTVIWLVPRRFHVHLCLFCIAGSIAFRAVTHAAGLSEWWSYGLTPARLDALAFGGLVAILARSAAGSAFLRRHARRAGLLAGAGLLAIWIANGRLDYRDTWTLILGLLLTAVVTGALIVGLVDDPERPGLRVFMTGWLRFIGRVSYGTYIFHWLLVIPMRPVLARLIALPRPFGLVLPVEIGWILLMIGLSVGVASLSFYAFERPFLRLKDRLAPSRA